jgi:hypothetical protein
MEQLVALTQSGPGEPWNKGKLVGQKAPLRLRPDSTSARHHARRPHCLAGNRNAAKDSTASAVRAHRADTRFRCHMDPPLESTVGELPLPESPPIFSTLVDAAICQDRPSMGEGNRPQLSRLWHAYSAAHKGIIDLSSNEESACRTVAAGPLQTREHCAVPRYRSRRRARDG